MITATKRYALETKTPSPAAADGWLQLVGGILKQAAADLRSPDPCLFLDALEFWLSPDSQIYLNALGLNVDLNKSFDRLFEVDYGKNQGLRPVARIDQIPRERHEQV
jgi:hypothetical protein